MKITYTQNGDYLIPDIKIRKAKKSIGHYGRLRKAYLQQFRPILYNELILTEKLYEHCAEIEETARHRIELIVPELEWVRQMNACKVQAEEIVKHELIYTP